MGAILVLLEAEFLGLVLMLMMAGEMTIMAFVMVMFMMNPAGLNPMLMVHQHRTAIAAGIAVFIALSGTILATDFSNAPATRTGRATEELGTELLGESMLAFETAGVALLATMIGAVAVASRRGRYGDAERTRLSRRSSPTRNPSRPPPNSPIKRRNTSITARGALRMNLDALLIVAAAIFGIGLYGALSQQSFVMLMMGLELMINSAILAAVASGPRRPVAVPRDSGLPSGSTISATRARGSRQVPPLAKPHRHSLLFAYPGLGEGGIEVRQSRAAPMGLDWSRSDHRRLQKDGTFSD